MSVYLLRHGQTDWNKKGIVQGRYDVPLNDTGREQAREAKKILDEVDFIACYVSPLCRARETAAIALEGRNVPFIIENRLVEMAYGPYEGTNWKAGDYQLTRRRLAYRYKDGESYLDLAYRAFSFLEEIREFEKKGNVLLVCHGGIARVINSYFIDEVDNDGFIDNICPNGGVRKYEYSDRYIAPVMEIPDELK